MGVHRDSGLVSSACASVLRCNAIFSFVVVVCFCCLLLFLGVGGGDILCVVWVILFSFLF